MMRPIFSLEFYPPKHQDAADQLIETARALKCLDPVFVTVTFGAGGSSKEGTLATCRMLQDQCGYHVGAHLSYFGFTKDALFAYADQLWAEGIKNLVVVRGDIPIGTDIALYQGDDYFHYTSDFVAALKTLHPFDISVGAYPEKHPDAPSMEADLIALEKKCAAGASRAITQFFYTTSLFENFMTQVHAHGIVTPIIPGLLPIGDMVKICGFAKKCGINIPPLLVDRIMGSPEPIPIASSLLSTQIKDMMALRVPHVHLYTLNRSDIIRPACVQLQLI